MARGRRRKNDDLFWAEGIAGMAMLLVGFSVLMPGFRVLVIGAVLIVVVLALIGLAGFAIYKLVATRKSVTATNESTAYREWKARAATESGNLLKDDKQLDLFQIPLFETES